MTALDRACHTLAGDGISAAQRVPMRDYTTLGVGGPADVLSRVFTKEEAASVLRVGRQFGLPVRCIGGGSNILVSDDGVDGIVVVNCICGLEFEGCIATVGAGVVWDDFVQACVSKGLAGVAGMSGIPGTIGGAVVGNAGAYGESVGDLVVSVDFVDAEGQLHTLAQPEMGFRYRESVLQGAGGALVGVTFTLQPGDTRELATRRQEVLAVRAAKHPAKEERTAGSFFKNVDDVAERARLATLLDLPAVGQRIAAGVLLDRAGARRLRVGDAVVYEKHANIVVNRGNASSADILELASRMEKAVNDAFNVRLHREVIWIGRSHPGTFVSEE